MTKIRYIDLFAGAGGLSEGFIQQGFTPVAHVELNEAACYTLKTRTAYHYLCNNNQENVYYSYLKGEITRQHLYDHIPAELLDTVISGAIGKDNKQIFESVDALVGENGVDLIVGGPPCQAYSVVGRAPLKKKKDDERYKLYIHYGRFLSRYKPKFFVFENVPGIFSAGQGKYYKNLKKYYRRIGYEVDERLVNAYDHGVVQNRKRVIVIGWQKQLEYSYPDFGSWNKKYFRDDIFSDLPPVKPGEINRIHKYSSKSNSYLSKTSIRNGVDFVSQHITKGHNEKDLKIYKLAINELGKGVRLKNDQIPEHMRTQKNVTGFLDRFKVVGDEPHTVIAHLSKDGHYFIHPDIKQLRSISVREAARIQSFPDDYFFEGVKEDMSKSAAFRQIGNAVPPLLAKTIAKELKKEFV